MVLRLNLEKGKDYIINVSNVTEAVCSSVSISTDTCLDPTYYNKFLKQQSMLQLAAINIHTDDFPEHEFLDIVIAIKATNEGISLYAVTVFTHTLVFNNFWNCHLQFL